MQSGPRLRPHEIIPRTGAGLTGEVFNLPRTPAPDKRCAVLETCESLDGFDRGLMKASPGWVQTCLRPGGAKCDDAPGAAKR